MLYQFRSVIPGSPTRRADRHRRGDRCQAAFPGGADGGFFRRFQLRQFAIDLAQPRCTRVGR
jgi:hypothetical protein